MKKASILILYIAHLLLMLAGIVFALLYFTQGAGFLAEGLSKKDVESFFSFRWWHVVVGLLYPIFMFLGVHLLFKRKDYAALVYGLGCGMYVVTNAASYIYAYLAKSKSTANFEDLWFSVLFVCLSVLVSFLSISQASRKNT